MTTIDFPADLLNLERSAWTAIQNGTLTVGQARAVHDGIAAFAAGNDLARIDVEMGVKRAVRHA
ncbi:hypothetical protein [Streptomyces sp. B21-083]|uniref:hypothetical protein n=1 Tax=Streptomyces sp. B21-083 TaxID=3039410 RepID=UPI002FF0B45C